jgi:DNA-directed RNA polymerase specialized sigma24 family protein
MPASQPVTHWLDRLKGGDGAAAQQLWERYFARLVGLARQQLRGVPRRVADAEDVALSALGSLCRGLSAGRCPRLADRDDLWALLVVITAAKAADLRQRQGRQKRGGGKVGGEPVLDEVLGDAAGAAGINQVVGAEPTPALAAQVAEQFARLLARLSGDEHRQYELPKIAVWKLEGYTNEEIAARLPCARATVERRLQLIRSLVKASAPS